MNKNSLTVHTRSASQYKLTYMLSCVAKMSRVISL